MPQKFKPLLSPEGFGDQSHLSDLEVLENTAKAVEHDRRVIEKANTFRRHPARILKDDVLEGIAAAEKERIDRTRAGITDLGQRRVQVAEKKAPKKETPPPQPKAAWEESPTIVAQAMYHQLKTRFNHDIQAASDDDLEQAIVEVRGDLEREMRAEAKAKGSSKEAAILNLLDKAEVSLRKSLGFTDTSLPERKPTVTTPAEESFVPYQGGKLRNNREAAYMEQAIYELEKNPGNPPEILLKYDATLRESTEQIRALEARYQSLPTTEKALRKMLNEENPFSNRLFPENARNQWRQLAADFPGYLKRAGDGQERDHRVQDAINLAKRLLESGHTYLIQRNKERFNDLARDPKFQQFFLHSSKH